MDTETVMPVVEKMPNPEEAPGRALWIAHKDEQLATAPVALASPAMPAAPVASAGEAAIDELVVQAPIEDLDEEGVGGMLEVLNPTGHVEIKWGRKKTEIEIAEAAFKDLLSKGYLAFKKTWIGGKGKPMTEFDVTAGACIFEAKPPVGLPTISPAAVHPTPATTKAEDKVEHSNEQTKEFDKKAKTTLVPPIQGG